MIAAMVAPAGFLSIAIDAGVFGIGSCRLGLGRCRRPNRLRGQRAWQSFRAVDRAVAFGLDFGFVHGIL